MSTRTDPAVDARFDSKFTVGTVPEGATTPCLLWSAGKTPDGYGMFYNGTTVYAHRYSWERENGPVPAGHYLRHPKCNNHACVQEDHIEAVPRHSKRPGVTRENRTGKWVAFAKGPDGRQHHGGAYDTEDAAATAAAELRIKLGVK